MKEHHRALMRELQRYGLKPRLGMTNGSHVRVEWEVGGKPYHVVTSNTPSDHRTALNARAQIRRQLKQVGLQPSAAARRVSSVPTEEVSLEERVEQLELDVVTLLDMFDARYQEGWDAAKAAVMKALSPAAEAPPVAPQRRTYGNRHRILLHVPFDRWAKAAEIAKSTGIAPNTVSVALNVFKHKGFVRHDPDAHTWRKTAEALK